MPQPGGTFFGGKMRTKEVAKQATSNTARFLGATLVAFGSILMIAVASVWTALAPSNVPVSFNGAEFAWLSLKQGLWAVMPAMMVLITACVLVGSVIFSAVALKGICFRAKLKGFVLSVGPFVALFVFVWTWADASGMELVQASIWLEQVAVLVGIAWGLWAPGVYALTRMSASQYMHALRRMATGLDSRQARIAEKREAKKDAKKIKQEQAKEDDGLFFIPGQPTDSKVVGHQPLHVNFKQENPIVAEDEPKPERYDSEHVLAEEDIPVAEHSNDKSEDPMDWLNMVSIPSGDEGDPRPEEMVGDTVMSENGEFVVALAHRRPTPTP